MIKLNEEFFKKSIMPNVADEFDDHNLTIEIDERTFFTNLIASAATTGTIKHNNINILIFTP